MKAKARQCVLAVWGAFDPIYYACSRLEYVEDTWNGFRSIFRVRVTKYRSIKEEKLCYQMARKFKKSTCY
ncbi:YkoP family protein [Parageobacillus galactosidasius]|uniref:YkoP family protein n=1 Tax=Parageobacillus galactosidasius TaxID=883812 RepID=UPI00267DD12D